MTENRPPKTMQTEAPEHRPIACRPVRQITLAAGFVCLGLGIAGLFLPVMPTTIFLLLALWCFSRSSERLQRWLYDHPRLGWGLRQWHRHRVIPPRAKVAALATMAGSFLLTVYLYAGNWLVPEIVGAVLLAVAIFILLCPSRTPA